MAGIKCENVVDRKLEGPIFQYCMVRMIVETLWTKNLMVILFVGYVNDSFYSSIKHGRDGCGEIVHKKLDGYLCCGVCNKQFLYFNTS